MRGSARLRWVSFPVLSALWLSLIATAVSSVADEAVVAAAGGSVLASAGGGLGSLQGGAGSYAYATLLYSDEYLLGARTLGQSIEATGTQYDRVALLAPNVSPSAEAQLRADGWRVRRVVTRANPNANFPARFWGVYTKLEVFALTEYDRVLYLDADTLIVRSLDDAFHCGAANGLPGFCANLKHSDRMNTGVMVLSPSEELHSEMVRHAQGVVSYTGGDQGFLNVFFAGFPSAPLWRPDALMPAPSAAPVEHGQQLNRLPGGFNYDVGLYILNSNRWMVAEQEVAVVHFTLGGLKPWQWYANWAIPAFRSLGWHEHRRALPAECALCWPGAGWAELRLAALLGALPLLALPLLQRLVASAGGVGGVAGGGRARAGSGGHSVFATRRHGHALSPAGSPSVVAAAALPIQERVPHTHAHAGKRSSTLSPASIERLALLYSLTSALAAVAISCSVLPAQMPTALGWALMYEWTFAIVRALYLLLAAVTHAMGARRASAPSAGIGLSVAAPTPKVTARRAAVLGAALALGLPWLSALLGITNIYVHLALVCLGVAIMAGFVVRIAPKLAMEHYMAGWLENQKKFSV